MKLCGWGAGRSWGQANYDQNVVYEKIILNETMSNGYNKITHTHALLLWSMQQGLLCPKHWIMAGMCCGLDTRGISTSDNITTGPTSGYASRGLKFKETIQGLDLTPV